MTAAAGLATGSIIRAPATITESSIVGLLPRGRLARVRSLMRETRSCCSETGKMKPLPVLEPGMTAEAQADFVSRCERLRHQGGLRNEAQARAEALRPHIKERSIVASHHRMPSRSISTHAAS